MPPPGEEILEILNQPFFYFSKGNQSTVFQSQDGKYVLKLFRYRRSIFPTMHMLKNWYKHNPKQNFQTKIHKTFNAAHLAYNEGREFTQVLYCHLNLTEGKLPIITLKVGKRTYQLALDRYRFALQKKADPFKTTLLSARKNPEEMHRLIQSFVSLLIKRSDKNIRNSDPNLGPNFGFLNGEAVEIDFGNYQKISPNLQKQQEEISHFLISLEQWIAKSAPEHLDFILDLRKKTETRLKEKL